MMSRGRRCCERLITILQSRHTITGSIPKLDIFVSAGGEAANLWRCRWRVGERVSVWVSERVGD